ncbi:MAG: D-alanine--D-alanine ligase [Deltaproteobacteria bacterium]|nr:D-alanine--D-alanine ligase [Deltaproteobacteria bacterium]
MKKIRVGIIFGGKSAEHEVSLQSAKNVIGAIDKTRFEPVLIGIDKQGQWHLTEAENYLLNAHDPKLIALNKSNDNVLIAPGATENQLMASHKQNSDGRIDVAFPILHGPCGEDGLVQGLLKLANIPFVGASVLGSAVGMDKDVMKRLLRDAGIPVADFITVTRTQKNNVTFAFVKDKFGLPVFVKPANMGSSVGISRVDTEAHFLTAVEEAFMYDRKVIIEECIYGREIECSVLGNENPAASLPGEVISNAAKHGFYSYEAKYIDENGATLKIPADLDQQTVKKVQALAVTTFKVLCCEGMARVDFFLKQDGQIFVNEINTIPGFTNVSMYPKLWEATGKGYTALITELIELALERHKEERALKTTVC